VATSAARLNAFGPDLVNASAAQVAESLRSYDWDFMSADTGRDGHDLHPYPAKFPPQLPEQFIQLLSLPGDLVLDCFGGSGTAAVEALRLGRRAISIDANPVASLVAKAKAARLSSDDFESLAGLMKVLANPMPRPRDVKALWHPVIPNVDRWYAPHVVEELVVARARIFEHVGEGTVRDAAMVAFAHAATRMSFQDSETRYRSVPREIEKGAAILRVRDEIRRLMQRLPILGDTYGHAEVIEGDARDRKLYPDSGTVGLVVTSPPYPNAYDYHLYHRFRILWLGGDPSVLRGQEIGSHLKNQSSNDPVGDYEADMLLVLQNVRDVLSRGRFAVFVVGDGLHSGIAYPTSEALVAMGQSVGFDHITTIQRRLPTHRRSVTVAGRRLDVEHLVVLRAPRSGEEGDVRLPPYELFGYEKVLARQELAILGQRGIKDRAGPRQAAFSYGVWSGRQWLTTLQAAAEADRTGGQRKNSTYGGHGIHRYKGKFYPQLAKSLINITDGYGPGVVLDPFGGSGTVAMESVLAGINAVSLDVNPVALAAAEAKQLLLTAPNERLIRAVALVSKSETNRSQISWEQFAGDCKDELESWFPAPVLARLSHLLAVIRSSEVDRAWPGIASVLEVLVSDVIRDCSHQEPTDLRIRRRKELLLDADVQSLFLDRAAKLIVRHSAIQGRLRLGGELGTATILAASAADSATFDDPSFGDGISAVVSSPPYGTALPYLDTDRLSLAAVFGLSKWKRAELEDVLIGSREIGKKEMTSLESVLDSPEGYRLPSSTLSFLAEILNAVRLDDTAGFRKRQVPSLLLRYFHQMDKVLDNIAKRMLPGGQVALVLGDSTTTLNGKLFIVPTVEEVAAIAGSHGFDLVDDLPITVTREALLNSRNAITANRIIRFRCGERAECEEETSET